MSQLTLDDPVAVAPARATDPETSWAAAGSVNVTRGQAHVLAVLRDHGPRTWIDEELIAACHLSPSGVRTRRHELMELGLVEPTGETRPMTTGRQAREYRLTRSAS